MRAYLGRAHSAARPSPPSTLVSRRHLSPPPLSRAPPSVPQPSPEVPSVPPTARWRPATAAAGAANRKHIIIPIPPPTSILLGIPPRRSIRTASCRTRTRGVPGSGSRGPTYEAGTGRGRGGGRGGILNGNNKDRRRVDSDNELLSVPVLVSKIGKIWLRPSSHMNQQRTTIYVPRCRKL